MGKVTEYSLMESITPTTGATKLTELFRFEYVNGSTCTLTNDAAHIVDVFDVDGYTLANTALEQLHAMFQFKLFEVFDHDTLKRHTSARDLFVGGDYMHAAYRSVSDKWSFQERAHRRFIGTSANEYYGDIYAVGYYYDRFKKLRGVCVEDSNGVRYSFAYSKDGKHIAAKTYTLTALWSMFKREILPYGALEHARTLTAKACDVRIRHDVKVMLRRNDTGTVS